MVQVDAVRIERNYGRTGGHVIHLHVVGYGWRNINEFAGLVGHSNAELAQLHRDLEDWAKEAPLWVQH